MTLLQVYEGIAYKGDARRYGRVNYQDGGEIRQADLTIIDREVVSCGKDANVLGCDRTENFAFAVPEALLRQVAASYAPGEVIPWRFKFKGASDGDDWEDEISPAEVAGFLAAVDAYKAAHALP